MLKYDSCPQLTQEKKVKIFLKKKKFFKEIIEIIQIVNKY